MSGHRKPRNAEVKSAPTPVGEPNVRAVEQKCRKVGSSQHVLVGAVALLTLLATTVRHVLSQESYDPKEAPSKGGPLERAATRICREGGARVTTNTRLADLNIQNLTRVDDRRIEVIANGLPMWGGSQLAVDTTLVSPLTRTGEPRSRGGTYAAAALHDARRSKERTYPELLNNRRCRLVVLGIEVGGRWSNEASNFICMLAKARARSSPPSLQAATSAALVSRWSALLTHAAATSFAASLLFENLSSHHNQDGDLPPLGHLLSHTTPPVLVSRLPAR